MHRKCLFGWTVCVSLLLGCSSDTTPKGTTDTPDAIDVADVADVAKGVDADGVDQAGDAGGWDYRQPWSPPREDWSSCPEEDYLGGLALHEKAQYYDWIVPRLHQVPADAPGHEAYSRVFTIHCDGDIPATIVPDEALPSCQHALSENNGLWTSLYVASQAFRYTATGDQEALRQLRRTLTGTCPWSA